MWDKMVMKCLPAYGQIYNPEGALSAANWHLPWHLGLPWWLSGKECTCSAGDAGSVLGGEDPTQSSILARNIPWTVEPGGLQSMGVTQSQTMTEATE